MAIEFLVQQKANPGNPTAPRKFYATAKSTGDINLRELSERIAEISTVSSIDTLAVLEALVTVLPKYLLDGKIVRLGDFGTFSTSLSSEGADLEEDFSTSMIKKVKVNFRPGKLIKTDMNSVAFKKV